MTKTENSQEIKKIEDLFQKMRRKDEKKELAVAFVKELERKLKELKNAD